MTTEFVAFVPPGLNINAKFNSPKTPNEEETFNEFIENNNPVFKKNKNLFVDYTENLKNYFIKYPHKKPKDFDEIQSLISGKHSSNKKNEEITWDYSSEDKTFKCRETKPIN